MANKGYGTIGLTGGSTGFVDKIDGALLADKDICAVFMQSGQTRIYVLDADSGLDEDTTNYSVITPDTNAGTKRWILTWSGGRVVLPDSTVDQGNAAVVGSLKWHIDDMSTDPGTITLLPGTYKITTTIAAVAATINLEFQKGALLKPDATKKITINSPAHIIAGKRQQIIDTTNNSTDPLLFTEGGIVYPEWWGAVGDKSTDDVLPINAAIQSHSQSTTKLLSDTGYAATDTIEVNTSGQSLLGRNSGGSFFGSNPLAVGTMVKRTGALTTAVIILGETDTGGTTPPSGLKLEDINIDANTTAVSGLKVQSTNGNTIKNVAINNLDSGNGLVCTSISTAYAGTPNTCQGNTFENIKVGVEGTAIGVTLTGAQTLTAGMGSSFNFFRNLRIIHDDGAGLALTHCDDNIFDGLTIQRKTGGTGRAVVLNSDANGHAMANWLRATHLSIAEGASYEWADNTQYVANDYVVHLRNMYQNTGGTDTTTTAPVHEVGAVADGSITWTYVSPSHTIIALDTGSNGKCHGNKVEIAGIDYGAQLIVDSGAECFLYHVGRNLSSDITNLNKRRPRQTVPPTKFLNIDFDDTTHLDWYEEATWTPVLTFATPGDISVGYSVQTGTLIRIGKQVTLMFSITTSSFTHTTASGDLTITGIPAAHQPTAAYQGALEFRGITKANYTNFNARTNSSQTYIKIGAGGSGQVFDFIDASDVPTGGTVILRGTITYNL